MATDVFEIALSRKEKKALPLTLTHIPVQYSERSLLCDVELPLDTTVATVKNVAVEKLEKQYNITLKNFRITVEPKPRSENQKWTELGKDAIVRLWSPENKGYAKLKNRPVDLESLKNDLRKEFDEMLSDQWQTFNAKLQEHELKLTQINIRLQEQSQELCRIKSCVDTLLLRVLMDDLRDVIADRLGKQSWHDIKRNKRLRIVEAELQKMREASQFATLFRSSALDMALLLV